jgi:peptide/nickel transport system ATP-binding protein
MTETILDIKNITIEYPINIGTVRAVEDVSVHLNKGEVLGLVGESGCGKSTLGLAILKLVREPGKIPKGEIVFKDKDILKMKDKELLSMRGKDIAMVFQNPLTSLNPLIRIDKQFLETIYYHMPEMSKEEALNMSEDILEHLGIERKRLYEFPHQLSGGMRQRIMIGLGLVMNPDIVICDEPTTSLDVIVEAGFIDLLNRLRKEYNLSIILITHNLGMVAEIADRIAVMYGAKIVEVGTAKEIFSKPRHPYTKGLIGCVPNIKLQQEELITMEGSPPDLVSPPTGCRFHPRCWRRIDDICVKKIPELTIYEKEKTGRKAACWNPYEYE